MPFNFNYSFMLTEKIIKLSEFFNSSSLNTRDEADKLFTFLLNDRISNKLFFDFDNINFISRSFADEFHKSLIYLTKIEHVTCELLNSDSNIIEILQAVSRTQNNDKRNRNNLPVFSFVESSSLYNFLATI